MRVISGDAEEPQGSSARIAPAAVTNLTSDLLVNISAHHLGLTRSAFDTILSHMPPPTELTQPILANLTAHLLADISAQHMGLTRASLDTAVLRMRAYLEQGAPIDGSLASQPQVMPAPVAFHHREDVPDLFHFTVLVLLFVLCVHGCMWLALSAWTRRWFQDTAGKPQVQPRSELPLSLGDFSGRRQWRQPAELEPVDEERSVHFSAVREELAAEIRNFGGLKPTMGERRRGSEWRAKTLDTLGGDHRTAGELAVGASPELREWLLSTHGHFGEQPLDALARQRRARSLPGQSGGISAVVNPARQGRQVVSIYGTPRLSAELYAGAGPELRARLERGEWAMAPAASDGSEGSTMSHASGFVDDMDWHSRGHRVISVHGPEASTPMGTAACGADDGQGTGGQQRKVMVSLHETPRCSEELYGGAGPELRARLERGGWTSPAPGAVAADGSDASVQVPDAGDNAQISEALGAPTSHGIPSSSLRPPGAGAERQPARMTSMCGDERTDEELFVAASAELQTKLARRHAAEARAEPVGLDAQAPKDPPKRIVSLGGTVREERELFQGVGSELHRKFLRRHQTFHSLGEACEVDDGAPVSRSFRRFPTGPADISRGSGDGDVVDPFAEDEIVGQPSPTPDQDS